jgi:ATP-dependent Clp protease ATP-binding subunit ClpA
MMLRVRRRRSKLAQTFERAPIVGELFAAAQDEAAAFRHDSIGTEHMLLALLGRSDETGSTLRSLGLELGGLRDEVRNLVGEGPAQQGAFDADALGAIGIDLQAVRDRVEAAFGEGALERASRRRGSCAGAAFGVAPQLKQALESARQHAERHDTPLSAADIALGLAQQRDSAAARILEAHAISPQSLRSVLEARRPEPTE